MPKSGPRGNMPPSPLDLSSEENDRTQEPGKDSDRGYLAGAGSDLDDRLSPRERSRPHKDQTGSVK